MESRASRTWFVLISLVGYILYFVSGKRSRAQQWLFERFSSLGGIYVKFLQLMALRDDASSIQLDQVRNALTVFDQAKFEPINITALLRSELGEQANRLQLHATQPFAAGSFAQVYGATLDGQEVIIKVLRPSVLKHLKSDLSLLGFAAKTISIFQSRGLVSFADVFNEFKRVTLREIDYENELKSALHMADRLANNAVIHIPKTYPGLSTRYIIVQERIYGLSLTEVLAKEVDNKVRYVWDTIGTNLNYVLEELAVELVSGTLATDGTHGDPHPGNIYILPDNHIALIDFGIDITIQENHPALLELLSEYAALHRGEFNAERFCQALVSYFVPGLTQSIQTLSTYLGRQDLVQRVLQEIGATAGQTLTERSGDAAISQMLQQQRMMYLFIRVINKDNRFGLQASLEAPAFLRSTQIFFKLVYLLDCDRSVLRNAFERVIATHHDIGEVPGPRYDIESIDQSMHMVASWFERLQYSDPKLYSRIIKTWEQAR